MNAHSSGRPNIQLGLNPCEMFRFYDLHFRLFQPVIYKLRLSTTIILTIQLFRDPFERWGPLTGRMNFSPGNVLELFSRWTPGLEI